MHYFICVVIIVCVFNINFTCNAIRYLDILTFLKNNDLKNYNFSQLQVNRKNRKLKR